MQFETEEDALKWRKVHRKKLEAGNKRQRRAARTLTKCRKSHRCEIEACRVCMRDFRIWWAGEAIKIMLQRPDWTSCSIITEGLLVPYGQLTKFDLYAQIKRLRKRIGRSKLHSRIVLGGLDISLNLENNKIIGWQFHLYLVVEGKDDAKLEQAVRDAFGTTTTTPQMANEQWERLISTKQKLIVSLAIFIVAGAFFGFLATQAPVETQAPAKLNQASPELSIHSFQTVTLTSVIAVAMNRQSFRRNQYPWSRLMRRQPEPNTNTSNSRLKTATFRLKIDLWRH
jgi:hypothetical protein